MVRVLRDTTQQLFLVTQSLVKVKLHQLHINTSEETENIVKIQNIVST